MTHDDQPVIPDHSPDALKRMTSPDAALEAAHNNQDQYEELSKPRSDRKDLESRAKLHHAVMAENNALLAIAGFLQQIRDMLTPDSFGDDPVPPEETFDSPMVGQPRIWWDTRLTTKPPLLGVGQRVRVTSKMDPDMGFLEYEVDTVDRNGMARLSRIYPDV